MHVTYHAEAVNFTAFDKTKAINNPFADYLQRPSALSVWVHCSVTGTDKATAVLITSKHHSTKAVGSIGTAPLSLKFGVILR